MVRVIPESLRAGDSGLELMNRLDSEDMPVQAKIEAARQTMAGALSKHGLEAAIGIGLVETKPGLVTSAKAADEDGIAEIVRTVELSVPVVVRGMGVVKPRQRRKA